MKTMRPRISLLIAMVFLLALAVPGVAYAAVSGFTFTPDATVYPGEDVTVTVSFNSLVAGRNSAVCIYLTDRDWFGTVALNDGLLASTVTTTSQNGVAYTREYNNTTLGGSTAHCPGLRGRYVFGMYASNGAPGGLTSDQWIFTLRTPSNSSSETMRALHRVNNRNSGTFRDAAITVNTSLTAYADVAGGCGGNQPCYTSLQRAIDYVAINGTIRLFSDFSGNFTIGRTMNLTSAGGFNISPAASGNTILVTGGTVALSNFDLFAHSGAGSAVVAVNGGTAIVKGNQIDAAGQTVFAQSGSGVMSAYANNISNIGQALTGSGNLKQNWWGSYSAQPTGLPAADWAARLAAPVVSWADGAGSASMAGLGVTSNGTASSVTAVIVNHGRSAPPFGNGVVPFVNSMCGEYVDFFVRGTTGTWQVSLTVDNNADCNQNVRDAHLVYRITNIAECAVQTDVRCWDPIPANVSANGQVLRVSFLSAADLGGTQFVVGSSEGTDPTVIELRSLTGASAKNTWVAAGLLAISLTAGGVVWFTRRKRS